MTHHQFPSSRSLALRCGAGLVFSFVLAATAQAADTFTVTDLITNSQVTNPAPGAITDPNLVNPWGVSFSSTSPLWVSDNGTGLSSVYSINPTTNAVTIESAGGDFPVTVNGGPTGQVFNSSSTAFGGDPFVFVTSNGTVQGWPGSGNMAQPISGLTTPSGASYDGATLVTVGGNQYLLAADAGTGNIDVFKGTSSAPNLSGTFTAPNLPSGSSPYNVQVLNNVVYVTYTNSTGGTVAAFTTSGTFISQIATGSALNSPWGLAIAPSSFGSIAGDLLVGNLGSGEIDIYTTGGSFVGTLNGTNGKPIVIQDLWSIFVGNNGGAGSSNELYFTAGSGGYSGGLVGAIQIASVPEPSTAVLGLIAMGALAGRWHWKNRRRAVIS
jgi:uncharacterized protein (TIGR03118 family)